MLQDRSHFRDYLPFGCGHRRSATTAPGSHSLNPPISFPWLSSLSRTGSLPSPTIDVNPIRHGPVGIDPQRVGEVRAPGVPNAKTVATANSCICNMFQIVIG